MNEPAPRAARASTSPRVSSGGRFVGRSLTAILALFALYRVSIAHPGGSAARQPATVLVRRPVMAPATATLIAPVSVDRIDTVGSRQALRSLLVRYGVSPSLARRALAGHRVGRDTPVTLRERSGSPTDIVVELAPDHLLRFDRTEGGWTSGEERLPWRPDTVIVRARVRSTLAAAFADAPSVIPRDKRTELAYTLSDIFEYKLDMSRDLQEGDQVSVLVECARGPHGATRMGRVLAAKLDLAVGSVAAVRYVAGGADGDYFDASGRSLRARFLRAPLAFRRVSSAFGRRLHPILGVWRKHAGTDYAAAQGTPVRAIGDGVVLRAGRNGGYGNVLEIRLRNGYVTRYGHLRNFAKGIRAGKRVAVGQTVAFVGTTGLSTAPHLHFEMLVNGRNRDPRVALKQLKGGEPIARAERGAFALLSARLLSTLESADGARVARTAN